MRIIEPFKRLLRVATRQVKEDRGPVVVPFRGYGSQREIFMIGRVFYQPTSRPREEDSTGRLLVQIGRRLLRRGIPDIAVEAEMAGSTQRTVTDTHGYFRIHMSLGEKPPVDRIWHTAKIRLAESGSARPDDHAAAEAEIFIPPSRAQYVVISDIDDTVMHTGVANKIKMFWRLFAARAESRVAFPGVAALYRAMHDGPSGDALNPILYVSRGPWGIYDMLDAFFNAHNIPVGPILFLREWDIRLRSPLPRRAKGHKKELVRRMLALYDEMPFILIGDSGQHDPEIYADIVREHPTRVKAIYIRHVVRSLSRKKEIAALAAEVEKTGSTLMLADDSYAMARHAAEHGFISDDALAKVLEERVRETETPPQRKTAVVEG